LADPARTVIVTGAASPRGIGLASADRMARDGWAVAILDRSGDQAATAAAALAQRYDVPALGLATDVADEELVDAAVSRVERDLPPVRALFNIAGVTAPTRFMQTTLEEWERLMRINVTGTYIVTKRAARVMLEAGTGRIVNMSSVSAIRGGGVFGGVPYSAAKAAILGFTRALAREFGPFGVTVNAVAPGVVSTDIREGLTTPEREASLGADVPLGRQGTAQEVAALFAFLASDDAAYITGATYDINGGSHIY
jgi:2-hydroxycyclohexanecarboxyl-CoA dehydrogenase